MCLVEGTGKPGKKRTYDLFGSHIITGSLLIHDGEEAHDLLVEKLELISEVHPTAETKGLSDDKNPLCEVNRMCALLKKFLGSHPGFTRDDLQGLLASAEKDLWRLSPDLNRIPQPLLLHLQPTLRQVRKDRETAGFDFQKSKNAPLQRLKLQFNAWNEVFQQHDAEMDF